MAHATRLWQSIGRVGIGRLMSSPSRSSQIPASMTAEELTLEILDRRNVGIREKDYWTCFEVNEREETGG